MKISHDRIDSVKIEHRCNKNVRSITVMIEPKPEDREFLYSDLVECATSVFCRVYADATKFNATDADVMAWSKSDNPDHRATPLLSPNLYRVTVDFRRDGTDEGCDGDDE